MLLKWIGTFILTIVLTAFSAVSASASTNTLSIGSPITLTDRVLVTIPMTIVCDPVDSPFSSFIDFSLKQADGQSVSTASGEIFSSPPALICDGVTQNTTPLNLTPNAGSGPFHGGGAILAVSFHYCSFSFCETGSFGPAPVQLRG